ncbi:MAG: abortive infection family protein [Gammaproteobacteria bacterium]|nr:abortive infection family protein [Gammaproteobacteria bacterium]
MERGAGDAAEYAGFIVAFCDACESLAQREIAVPGHSIVNKIRSEHGVSYQIINNVLLETDEYVRPPEPHPSISRVVDKVISDAKFLIGQSGASSAIDRAFTVLYGYLISLCNESGIETSEALTISYLFKLLREQHAVFSRTGARSSDVNRVLKAFATLIDAFATIRNKASLVHANELMDDPEATAMVNAMFTIFRYIQVSLLRHEQF